VNEKQREEGQRVKESQHDLKSLIKKVAEEEK
jgi:hypothetical protein